MKNQKMIRPFTGGAFLFSCLALLSACDMVKKGGGCASCETGPALEAAAPGDVLLTIDGKPAITKGIF